MIVDRPQFLLFDLVPGVISKCQLKDVSADAAEDPGTGFSWHHIGHFKPAKWISRISWHENKIKKRTQTSESDRFASWSTRIAADVVESWSLVVLGILKSEGD